MRTVNMTDDGGNRSSVPNAKGASPMGMQNRGNTIGSLVTKSAVILVMFVFALVFSEWPTARALSKAIASPNTATVNQKHFATPEVAVEGLVTAAKTKDRAAFAEIFGPEHEQLYSGDPVEDEKDLNDFAKQLEQSARLRKDSENKYTLLVGETNWPMPIPIVKQGNAWVFDTKAGLEEILNRRIGDDELSAIATCRAYVVAQWEYFTEGEHDVEGLAQYAQRFVSSPGKKDGLYWPTAEGEKPSPFGELVAEARAEGYGPKDQSNSGNAKPVSSASQVGEKSAQTPRRPFHGYYFKILTRQGPSAHGGRYNYIINGNMIAGFAMVAYPAKWGNSGVMTFIVSQQGRVYQKNLGPNTEKLASAIAEYNPDPSWKPVQP